MKKLILFISLALALTYTGQAFAADPDNDGLGIAGSSHDFTDGNFTTGGALTDETWNTSGEICRVCHVPHDAQAAATANLLWSRATTASGYTLYDSDSLDAATNQPTGTAKLCLSCHDGQLAIDTFDTYAGGNVDMDDYTSNGAYTFGTDLSNDHPVSVLYATDTSMKATTTTLGGGTIADVLDNGMVQCSSCHDVHNQDSIASTSLLRVTNSGSALCLTCHDK